jgi:hypothetical protein
MAADHPGHAVVVVWDTAEKVFDNGKPPAVPTGWYPATALIATPLAPRREEATR